MEGKGRVFSGVSSPVLLQKVELLSILTLSIGTLLAPKNDKKFKDCLEILSALLTMWASSLLCRYDPLFLSPKNRPDTDCGLLLTGLALALYLGILRTR
jgi:hypothetical protein